VGEFSEIGEDDDGIGTDLVLLAQLIQRSNQFNLVTNRHTEAECEAMMRDESVIPLYAELRDRLGDHGLVSIVILRPQADRLEIGDWLMSCRVLKRGVEVLELERLLGYWRPRLGGSRPASLCAL